MQAAGHEAHVPSQERSEPVESPEPAVLAFFAHPDDETLGAGGAIARLARTNRVHLVTATRGELGERMGPVAERAHADPIALAGIRVGELAAAARALGIESHRFLDELDGAPDGRVYTDSGMAWADDLRRRAVPAPGAAPTAFSAGDLEEEARILAGEIERLRPRLVLTEEVGGGYGHPDHVRAHAVAVRAVEIAEPRWRVPVVAATVRDHAALVRAQEWVAGHPARPAADVFGAPLRAPDPAAPQSSGAQERPDLVIDTSAQSDQVIAAMTAHHTQVHEVTRVPGGLDAAGWYALTNNDLQPILTHAAFAVVAGHGSREELADAFTGPTRGRPPGPVPVGPATRWAFAGLGVGAGALAGAVTTVMHRSVAPWGLIAGIAVLYAGMLLARSLGDRWAANGFGAGVLGIVLAMTAWRPAGDVIIVQDVLGLGWLAAVFAAVLAGMLAPSSWFALGWRPRASERGQR
ncbi:PIG-L family deacetylase [Pseudactinotalea sp. HY158]|uniref:PIG-L family deacetylase n=1 Tax=Pseudactinotalea sp. HY158 TaxID=2654547 RepID=UPI00129D0439|nr:PIG-L family deacetylase [Pseudactinotalea sp. HY158]QGH68766.1 hypothetical protein GCE65_04090 [Pseudactinotalea sp. HY158]